MLSLLGWFRGIICLVMIFFSLIFGLTLIIKAKKNGVKVLYYAAASIIFMGLVYLGTVVDFIHILITGTNSSFSNLIGILNIIWLGPIGISFLAVSSNILFPDKKKYILIVAWILGIATILVIISTSEYIIIRDPVIPGEIPKAVSPLYQYNLPFVLAETILMILFNGIGFMARSIKSEGIVKRKYALLSIAYLLYPIIGLSYSFFPDIFDFRRDLITLSMLIVFFLIYFSLKEESAEPKEKIKKDVEIEGDLFRISKKRPSQITEEEVTYYRDLKICLVCKGKATKYTFICDNCNALYCIKCAEALTGLENQCWACNHPIDDSKPVNALKMMDSKIRLEANKPDINKKNTNKDKES